MKFRLFCLQPTVADAVLPVAVTLLKPLLILIALKVLTVRSAGLP